MSYILKATAMTKTQTYITDTTEIVTQIGIKYKGSIREIMAFSLQKNIFVC